MLRARSSIRVLLANARRRGQVALTQQVVTLAPTTSTTTTLATTVTTTTTALPTTTTTALTTTTTTTSPPPTTTTVPTTTVTTATPACEVVEVHLSGSAYSPATVNVRIGDSILWIWDSGTHNVASATNNIVCIDSDVFRLGDINGNPVAAPFNVTQFINEPMFTPGTQVPFICDVHCVFGMRGVINVAVDPCPATTVITTTLGPTVSTTAPPTTPTVSTTAPPTTTGGGTTTTGVSISTTIPVTTIEPQNCLFINPGFESGSPTPGWYSMGSFTQVLASAYNPATLSYSIFPSGGLYMAQAGWSGPGGVLTGQGYLYQDINIPACNATLSFNFRTYANSNGYGRISMQIANTDGAVLVNIFSLTPPVGVSDWSSFSCSICDGSCGGLSLQPYVGQTLRFVFGADWTTYQVALWVDNVCLLQENMPTITGPPISTAISTTAPTPQVCVFQNNGFETGMFAPFWNTFGTYYYVVNGGAYNPYQGLYNLVPYSGAYQSQFGFSGPATVDSARGSGMQDIVIPSCGHSLSFAYRTLGTSPDYATIYVTISNLTGTGPPLATVLQQGVPLGDSGWIPYSCDICSGACGGLDMTPYIGERLRFEWGVYWSSFQAALWVDEVCMASIPTTTPGATVTTTYPATTTPAVVGPCVFDDEDFESGAFGNGWNAGGLQQSIVTGNAYNPITGLYDLAPFSGSDQAQVGYPGPTSISSGNGYISQLFYVSACGTLSFRYRTYAEQPGYVVVSATISTQAGTQLASLYSTQAPTGVSAWTLYSCDTCGGTCGGFSLAPYVGQLLKLTFGTTWSTFQGAQWVDSVCLQTGGTTTTGVPTTAPVGDVCFVNSGFETGSFSPGWTPTSTYQAVTSAAYNVFSSSYNIFPYAGGFMGMAGYSGPGSSAGGSGQFKQTIAIPGCGYRFQFYYRAFSGFYGYNSISAFVQTVGGAGVATFISVIPPQGWNAWTLYSCDLCSTCPINFTPYIGQNLVFFWSTSWYNNAPSALLVDQVCFTAIPVTTTTTAFTGTTTLFTGTTTTVLTTTTIAPTTSPYSCFTNSGFESGSFAPGWLAGATYQYTPTAVYNVFTGLYDIYPYAGSYMAMAGYSGPGVISSGAGAFYQDIVIPPCGGSLTFKYRLYAGLYPYVHTTVRAFAMPSSTLLGYLINAFPATGWTGWTTYSCTMCSGTCPFNFAPYVGTTVRFYYQTDWSNNAPGAMLVDNVCFV